MCEVSEQRNLPNANHRSQELAKGLEQISDISDKKQENKIHKVNLNCLPGGFTLAVVLVVDVGLQREKENDQER